MNRIKRILYYTHNSIGIGHVFRARAIISAIQRQRPDIDFLVLSGTSVPHILLREGIEVIKLPGIEKMVTDRRTDGCDQPLFRPRHLRNMPLDGVMRLRRKIIAESFRWFQPDVAMVEHYMGGLLGEMTAVLKKNHRTSPAGFVSVALSRGIMGLLGEILTTSGPPRPESMMKYFDYVYFLEDGAAMERGGSYGKLKIPTDTHLACLGRITDKCREELPGRDEVLRRFRLPDKPIVLLSLSRHGHVADLCIQLLEVFRRNGIDRDHQVIFVIDPYLAKEALEKVQRHPLAAPVRFLPFFYPLIDIIQASDLVVCRAGYNTINELLLTGVKALVIPEAHPSGEQEARVQTIPLGNIAVLGEEEVLREPPAAAVRELIARKPASYPFDFNKYAIAARIMADLEARLSSRGGSF